MNVNVNFIEQNVSYINGGILVNVDVGVKKIIYVKKIVFGILLHVIVKMENICDEVIEPYDEEIKIIPTNFYEKKVT